MLRNLLNTDDIKKYLTSIEKKRETLVNQKAQLLLMENLKLFHLIFQISNLTRNTMIKIYGTMFQIKNYLIQFQNLLEKKLILFMI